ncbi:MAG: glutamate 5-kinase [Rikenellaceae bacterium]
MIKRVVIKIGSNVLTRANGGLDTRRMSDLTRQVVSLRNRGIDVILVSSGAVASGREEISPNKKLDSVAARQLFSAVGQTKLVNKYYNFFKKHHIVCGQVLTTKESLSTRGHYLNQRNCMRVMLENGVVPIVNENDTISVTELMFTDNDELSGMVATMMDADALIILSNIDGIYNGNPADKNSEVIRVVSSDLEDLSQYISTTRSSFGRGGMLTKCRIASKVADEGVEVIIANGKRRNILEDLILGEGFSSVVKRANNRKKISDLMIYDRDLNLVEVERVEVICTRFVPSDKKISTVKKWVAHSDGFAKGKLYVNQGAYQALMQPKATSLLPVGVSSVEGEFEKDDIVTIISPDGESIGVGRVAVDSQAARESAGQKGHRAIIHYDYMYIE